MKCTGTVIVAVHDFVQKGVVIPIVVEVYERRKR